MKINKDRLIYELTELRQITATPGQGVTRFSYSREDSMAREFIKGIAEEMGASLQTDSVGNIVISMPQDIESDDYIIAGSHIDTVRNGGWLDGIYGVVAALEVMRALIEDNARLKYGYKVVIFAEEEGSNFGSTMTGSKFITGRYGVEHLDQLVDSSGVTLRQMLSQNAYYDSGKFSCSWDMSHIKAMLELHIEQGPVLENSGLNLGIVRHVFGMDVIEVTIEGVGNHAGASPMDGRRDALTAAAECVLAAERIASEDPEHRLVATTGILNVEPGCSNVIPGRTVFTIEVRDSDNDSIGLCMNNIQAAIESICENRCMKCSVREVASSGALKLSDRITDILDSMAASQNIDYKVMDSGAVHDACMIAQFVPTGMIFVPSIDGRSHVPYEDTPIEQLVMGAQFLADAILKLQIEL